MNLRRPNLLRFLIFLSVIHSNDAQNDFTSKLDKLFKQISQQPEVKGISNILRPKFTDSERIDLVFNNQSTITCQKQWDLILSYQKWQITKFWDSWSHVWTGQLEGNINFLGQSEECLNVKNGVMPVTLENFPDTKPFLIFYKQDPTDSFEYNIVICMPAVCPKQEVAKLFKEYKNPDENQPPFVSGASSQADIQITAGAVIAWVVFGIIGVLIVQGTSIGIQRQLLATYRYYQSLDEKKVKEKEDESVIPGENEQAGGKIPEETTPDQEKKPSFIVQIFLCFDCVANLKKIFTIPANSDPSQMKCLNGIRVMSMAWVILGHILMVSLAYIDNPLFMFEKSQHLLILTLTNATPSVDTFFVLSGLLVMLGSLRALEKLQNPLDVKFWTMFYIHRVIRLWPTLLLGILFVLGFVPLFKYFTQAPYFQPYIDGSFIDLCDGTKWMPTAFFYGNFITYKVDPCLEWTWYVANDMQFYVLSPIVILAVHKRRQIGVALISSLVFASCLVTLVISAAKNVLPAEGDPLLADPEAASHYSSDSYYSDMLYYFSYCRFHTYGVGLLLGLAIHEKKKLESMIEKLSVYRRVALIVASWTVAVLFGVLSIYGVYPTLNGHPMDRTATAFYNGSFRLIWAIAVSLVILLCLLGYGGIANRILSHNFWIPFARINYTTYIVHLTLIYARALTMEKFTRYSTIQFVLESSGMLALIFCSSFPLCVIMETPFINLEKLLLKGNRKS